MNQNKGSTFFIKKAIKLSKMSSKLRLFVKINNITNLSDARYCAGMGAKLLGFSLDKSSSNHYISPTLFQEVTGWVHGVSLVGEVEDPLTIAQVTTDYAINYIQLNHPIPVAAIANSKIPIISKVILQGNEPLPLLRSQFALYTPYVTYFLLEMSLSTTSTDTIYWKQVIKVLSLEFPIIQGFHITPQNLTYWMEKTAIQGIAISGSNEEKVGYKDYALLANILEPFFD